MPCSRPEGWATGGSQASWARLCYPAHSPCSALRCPPGPSLLPGPTPVPRPHPAPDSSPGSTSPPKFLSAQSSSLLWVATRTAHCPFAAILSACPLPHRHFCSPSLGSRSSISAWLSPCPGPPQGPFSAALPSHASTSPHSLCCSLSLLQPTWDPPQPAVPLPQALPAPTPSPEVEVFRPPLPTHRPFPDCAANGFTPCSPSSAPATELLWLVWPLFRVTLLKPD